jgi:hypothetical protein
MASESKDLAALKAQELAAMNEQMAMESGAGFEEADRDSYAIPFLKLLQDLSPEVDKKKGTAITGAVSGMFYNSATGDLYDGEKGVLLLPVHFIRRFLRWSPRNEGGGFHGGHTPSEVLGMKVHEEPDQQPAGALWLEDGTFLTDTREHYCLVARVPAEGQDIGEVGMAVVSLSSTQIKWSKKWMSSMQARRLINPAGQSYCPPMYSMWWHAKAMVQTKGENSWYGWQLTPERPLASRNILEMARGFRESILSGVAKAEQPEAPVSGDIPF